MSAVDSAKRLVARLKASHLGRSYDRYSQARGNVLAAGIAFFAFFSIGPALIVGFTIFGLVLAGQEELRQQVLGYLDSTLPGLLRTSPGDSGLVDPDDLLQPNLLRLGGAVALLGLLWTGLGWLDATRQGMRAVFGSERWEANMLVTKLRDVGTLATLGLGVLASVLLSLAVNVTTGTLLGLVGIDDGSAVGRVVLPVLGVVVVAAADTLIFLILLRLLPGITLPRRDLLSGAVVGGIGLSLLKASGGLLLGGASSNPLAASAGIVLGLLLWLSLVSRLTLLAAAWAATTASDRGSLVGGQVRTPTPAPPPVASMPHGPREATLPTFGQRSADRTTLAAGAVLGALAAGSLAAVGSGLRGLASVLRADRD